jgi:triacylglycerol lipase
MKDRARAFLVKMTMVVFLVSGSSISIAGKLSEVDPFYAYDGDEPLSSIPLGTVLKTRNLDYKMAGIPTPLDVVQILYRTNSAQNEATANVTSVIMGPYNNGKVISYQSAYDSLNPFDSPSAVISENKDISKTLNLGPLIYTGESIPLTILVKAGYTIIVPDTEGPTANFVAGPEYGMTTLDSIRAALNTPETGLNPYSKVALIGYSGGAIATAWAAAMAPTYAKDLTGNFVGAAYGGLLVSPINNLEYVNNSIIWGGIAVAAVAGLAKSYDIDALPLLNEKGAAALRDANNESIAYILPKHLGLNWKTLLNEEALQQYEKYQETGVIPKELSILSAANDVNLGLRGSPSMPIYFTQGSVGFTQGTFSPLAGDGVMLAGDARSLVHQYCNSRTRVQYNEVPADHVGAAVIWAAGMLPWLERRFNGYRAPSNCWLTRFYRGTSIDAIPVEQ